jgi:1-deoxy-D-xylulose-5-phosphate reductoisomerase
MKKNITILGATGSIGTSTLDLLLEHKDKFELFAVSAYTQLDPLIKICTEFSPKYIVCAHPELERKFSEWLSKNESITSELIKGPQSLEFIASHPDVDTVVAAIVGSAGLPSVMAAAQSGKCILLANKESLVMAGSLLMREVRENNAQLLPIDSEHNAIFQCVHNSYVCGEKIPHIEKILLTGSGGPFRTTSKDQLMHVTPEQACNHPNWSMGKKISVDSATMMNKGLELIEACFLFDCKPCDIQVLIHPNSIIHSMVEYIDGSVIAQLGSPDMRTPIAHALAWPERISSNASKLDFLELANLDFYKPDLEKFPCLRLAIEAANKGQSAMIACNAANEIAVESFLSSEISFTDISSVIERVMRMHAQRFVDDEIFHISEILEQDLYARTLAKNIIV